MSNLTSFVEQVARASQLLAGYAVHLRGLPDPAKLSSFFDLPGPMPAEAGDRLAAGALLSGVTLRLGDLIHSRLHDDDDQQCRFAFAPADPACFVCARVNEYPKAVLQSWAADYCARFLRAHDSVTMRATLLIEERFAEPHSVADIAMAVGCSPRTLLTHFRAKTGITLVEYRTKVRVWHAMAAVIAGEKIECAALDVGWRSKKDFYRGCATSLGVTPYAARPWGLTKIEHALFSRVK